MIPNFKKLKKLFNKTLVLLKLLINIFSLIKLLTIILNKYFLYLNLFTSSNFLKVIIKSILLLNDN